LEDPGIEGDTIEMDLEMGWGRMGWGEHVAFMGRGKFYAGFQR